jgi:DNA-directed RNA polymerase specialized sigma subunit
MAFHRTHIVRMIRFWHLPAAEFEDLVQVGQVAMRVPILRFDATRATLLWPYARWFVRGAMVTELGAQAGLSAHQTQWYKRVKVARDRLFGRSESIEPGVDDVRDALRAHHGRSVGEDTVAAILGALERKRVSINHV